MKKFTALITSILLTACQSMVDHSEIATLPTTENHSLETKTPIAGGIETLYVTSKFDVDFPHNIVSCSYGHRS